MGRRLLTLRVTLYRRGGTTMKSYIALIEGASWSQELSFVYMYLRFNFSDIFYYVLVRSNGKIMIYHFESFFFLSWKPYVVLLGPCVTPWEKKSFVSNIKGQKKSRRVLHLQSLPIIITSGGWRRQIQLVSVSAEMGYRLWSLHDLLGNCERASGEQKPWNFLGARKEWRNPSLSFNEVKCVLRNTLMKWRYN